MTSIYTKIALSLLFATLPLTAFSEIDKTKLIKQSGVFQTDGKASSASIYIGASDDGGVTTAREFIYSKVVSIEGLIEVDSDDVGKAGDIFVVMRKGSAGSKRFYALNESGVWESWGGSLKNLPIAKNVSSLSENEKIEVYSGKIELGQVIFYVGYSTNTENSKPVIHVNGSPQKFTSYDPCNSNCEKKLAELNDALDSGVAFKNKEVEEYENAMTQIESFFVDQPDVKINYDKSLLKSTMLSISQFVYEEDVVEFDLTGGIRPPKRGVGYSGNTAQIGSSTFIALNTWSAFCIPCGSAFLAEYSGGKLVDLIYKPIEGGGNNAHILKNSDGSHTAVFVGHDEAAYFVPDPRGGTYEALAPTYFYNIEAGEWSKSEYLTMGHSVSVLDYDKDGDEDIFVGISEKGMAVLNNNNSVFDLVSLGLGDWHEFEDFVGGWSISTSHSRSDDSIEIFLGDSEWNKYWENGDNVLLTFSQIDKNLEANPLSQVTDIQILPTPYFDEEEFDYIETNFNYDKPTTHDVNAVHVDIDGDGDNDIVSLGQVWSNDSPYGIPQILVNHAGEYHDETDARLHNFLRLNSYHAIKAQDVNNDGHLDLLLNDNGFVFQFHDWTIDGRYLNNSELLINDGTGHFVSIARHQLNHDQSKPRPGAQFYDISGIPWMSSTGYLNWTIIRAQRYPDDLDNKVEVFTNKLNMKLSTGPNGIDPEEYGADNYNEFYYLRHNPDVLDMINSGIYRNGLEHFISVGQAEGRVSHVLSKMQ